MIKQEHPPHERLLVDRRSVTIVNLTAYGLSRDGAMPKSLRVPAEDLLLNPSQALTPFPNGDLDE